jgi:hypothetical protein
MKADGHPFRADLRSTRLCMELDCNTVFDARYQACPTCGSVEFYPLETWLNRHRATSALSRADMAESVQAMGRAVWAIENARRAVRAVRRVQAAGV